MHELEFFGKGIIEDPNTKI